jgi:hypothetical protein
MALKVSTLPGTAGKERSEEWQKIRDKFQYDVKLSSRNTGLRSIILDVQRGTLVNTDKFYDALDEAAGGMLRETHIDH